MNACLPSNVVLGQYVGYTKEQDVAPDSKTETFAALKVEIDNWRWAGVPFLLRTGKKLKRKLTEITLSFNDVPYNVFKGTDASPPGRDHLTIRVQPNEGITMDLNVKKPGPGLDLDRAEFDFDYERTFHRPLLDAYALLILEAMEGDHTLFMREDNVERAWEVMMPVIENPPEPLPYNARTWGPEAAQALVMPRHWYLSPPRDRGGAPS